jgi:hypothetical protein
MPKSYYAFDSQAKQFLAPGWLMQQHVESSFRHADRSCTICMSARLFYHIQRQNIGAGLTSLRLCRRRSATVTPRHHQAGPHSCQKLGTWQRELWVSQSGLPILNQFKNSSHTDQILGGTLLSRKNITARLHPKALSPQCYPITPNSNGSTFECRQQQLAFVMVRVIWAYHSAAALSS